MPNYFAMTSQRLAMLLKMQDMYQAATDIAAPDTPSGKRHYGITFDNVVMGPIADQQLRKRFTLGIVADPERKNESFPVIDPLFDVAVEFAVVKQKADEEPGILAERVLAVVQQIIYDDRSLGDLAIDVTEIGSTVDLTTYSDSSIRGVVQWRIQYRHSQNNVYTDQPTV
jgi:hypothetical protein